MIASVLGLCIYLHFLAQMSQRNAVAVFAALCQGVNHIIHEHIYWSLEQLSAEVYATS